MDLDKILIELIKEDLNKLPEELHKPVISYLKEVNLKYLVILYQRIDSIKMEQAKRTIKFSTNNFFSQSLDDIKSLLLEDESFDNFMQIYNIIFELCVNKANGENVPIMSDKEYESTINKLDEYKSKIKDYNLKKADYYYGELLINLEQLKGNDITSLSVHRAL